MEHTFHFSHSPVSLSHTHNEKVIAIKSMLIPFHRHHIPAKYKTIKLLDFINHNVDKTLNKSLNIIVQSINHRYLENTTDVLQIKPYCPMAKPKSISANKTPINEKKKQNILCNTHCEGSLCFSCEKCEYRNERPNRNKSINILSSITKNNALLRNYLVRNPNSTDKFSNESIRKSRLLKPILWRSKDCADSRNMSRYNEGSKHDTKMRMVLKQRLHRNEKNDGIGRWDVDIGNNQFTSGLLDIQ
jgi:hypothetical protein